MIYNNEYADSVRICNTARYQVYCDAVYYALLEDISKDVQSAYEYSYGMCVCMCVISLKYTDSTVHIYCTTQKCDAHHQNVQHCTKMYNTAQKCKAPHRNQRIAELHGINR